MSLGVHFAIDEQTAERLLAAADDDEVAARVEEIVWTLPPAPWFEPGAAWSVRTVVLHLIGETSQHSGHADFLREALDGAKTMG